LPPTGLQTESGSSKKPRPAAGKLHRRRLRRTQRLFSYDRSLGSRFVAGCDEAGRGSLAGPLVAAAVLLDYENLSLSDRRSLAGLHDSKQMTAERREEIYPCVIRAACRVSVIVRSAPGIDGRGLHVTNLDALGRALERVRPEGAICLVDGFRLGKRCAVPHRAVVQGDATSAAIAAASIIAKVTRDRYMERAGATYPGWDFHENVGYSTPEHREAITRLGICAIHRRSFASVAYRQLELAGGSAGSEGVADVLVVPDGPVGPDGHADDVEADLREAG
jgi:ribonuclease HII